MEQLRTGDAVLVVDVQVDFCPGGALPIPGGDEVVPVLNRWVEAASKAAAPVLASRDWHPDGHVSFTAQGGPWPPHCLQDSQGARFHPDLRLPGGSVIITKGVRLDQDQNSAFDETGLETYLKENGVKRLWVGGLAQDVCVLATVLDARRAGFEVVLLRRATRPVEEETGLDALKQMRGAGAEVYKGLPPG